MLKGIKVKISSTNKPPPDLESQIESDKRPYLDSPTHQESFAWEEQPKKSKILK